MHHIGTICPGDYTAVLYFSTKSVKIVVNPNNDIPFTAVSWQLNIERSKLWLCSFQIYTILFLRAVVLFKKQNRSTQMP